MPTAVERAERFRELHSGASPLLMPNAWDQGSAKLFEALGFEAIATTSSGHAATFGRLDGGVTLDEVVAHVGDLANAVDIPVSADFENGFADDPEEVATNVARVAAAGAAGCSVEDFTRHHDDPVYDIKLASERVGAAAEAAHRGPARLVLTARAENFIRGRRDLADTIARLQAYQAAGADALFAPGVTDLDDLRTLVAAVDLPVSVLVLPGTAPVDELGAIGVKRISVGGGFARVALGAVVSAAQELQEKGTYGWWSVAQPAGAVITKAFAQNS